MANPLDLAYDRYWNSSRSRPQLDDLMTAVRQTAKRLTGDDDATQDACLYVISHLNTFSRSDATAFSRWVYSICRRRRLESYRSRSHEEFSDATYMPDDDSFRDYSSLPDPVLYAAYALASGMTLDELALKAGIKKASLRRRILRNCVT